MNLRDKTFGQIAWEAWHRDDEPLSRLAWAVISQDARDRWETAAAAVVQEHLRREDPTEP
jgi:hypothetical protein